jgi:hypothetical protein
MISLHHAGTVSPSKKARALSDPLVRDFALCLRFFSLPVLIAFYISTYDSCLLSGRSGGIKTIMTFI